MNDPSRGAVGAGKRPTDETPAILNALLRATWRGLHGKGYSRNVRAIKRLSQTGAKRTVASGFWQLSGRWTSHDRYLRRGLQFIVSHWRLRECAVHHYNHLLAYRNGRRKYPPMNCPSELRLDMYLQAMADLLREPASGATASAHRCQPQRLLKRGDALVTNGDGFRQIPACESCHGTCAHRHGAAAGVSWRTDNKIGESLSVGWVTGHLVRNASYSRCRRRRIMCIRVMRRYGIKETDRRPSGHGNGSCLFGFAA